MATFIGTEKAGFINVENIISVYPLLDDDGNELAMCAETVDGKDHILNSEEWKKYLEVQE
ncbi:hypothetical protein ACF8EF_01440 [Pseudomonas sp. zjy_15]|uniref:hypothetical protein n=1 Tax=Pseudomonas sp. zjy_15 TaxID=3367265 RepID=UPI00370A6CCC